MEAGALMVSFLVGAAAVCTLSVTADRFGSKLAGALGGFPATVGASLFFIGLTHGVEDAASATTIIPMQMGVFGILLAAYAALLRDRVILTLSGATVLWLLISGAALFISEPSIIVSLTLFVVMLLISYLLVEYAVHIPSQAGRRVTLTLRQLLLRALAGGSVVSGSVVVAQLAGPLFGGLVASFPAVTIATLFVTYQSGGAALSRAFAKSIMLSGMVNVSVYALAVRYLYPLMGLYLGTGGAILVSCMSGLLVYIAINRWVR